MNLYAYLDDDLVSMHLSERLLSFESEVADMSVKVYVQAYTGGPLLTLFFETLEKQLCKQKTV